MSSTPRRFSSLILLAALALLQSAAAAADRWTQWRGPQRDGLVAAESPVWPASLSEPRLEQAWTTPLGPSYSGPIVSDKHVYVTETRDEAVEVVRALDRATGEVKWEAAWEGAMRVPFFAAANGSWIRATPALDGQRLYVAGMRDVLVCLDAESGEVLWKLDFVAETGSALPSFGFVSSPLVLGDHVYVQAGGAFCKVDKLRGKIIWKVLSDEGGMNGSAFSSPVHATIAGVPQLLVQTRRSLAGVDPAGGEVLWSREVEAFRGMNILTPLVIGDRVFTSSYGGGSVMFELSRAESQWKVETAWTHKSQAYMSSPLLIDGHIYMHLRNQRFLCLDAATGQQKWITGTFGKYWSMAANGGRILALDERGELLLIDASPEEFKLLDRREIADNSWAHLAVAGEEVYVRDLNALKRLDWRAE